MKIKNPGKIKETVSIKLLIGVDMALKELFHLNLNNYIEGCKCQKRVEVPSEHAKSTVIEINNIIRNKLKISYEQQEELVDDLIKKNKYIFEKETEKDKYKILPHYNGHNKQ